MSTLREDIHGVLLRWNPLGGRGPEEIGDPVLERVLTDFRGEEKLADLLHALEVDYLNLAGDFEKCREVAGQLTHLVQYSLTECRACGKRVAKKSAVCAHCGESLPG
jgi:hypothetical protein